MSIMMCKLVWAMERLHACGNTILKVTVEIVLRVVLVFDMPLEDKLRSRSYPTLTTAVVDIRFDGGILR